MKQETKDLIIWIKKQINFAYKNCIVPAHKDGYKEYEADYNKAFAFLDSLPEIESHLCKGGYIQDKNGTPCCDGDKVKFKFYESQWMEHFINKFGLVTTGILEWNVDTKEFIVAFGDGDWVDFTSTNDGAEWFEKVE